MATQKVKKQVSGLTKKQFNKNSPHPLKQKPRDYFRFFIPFIIIITAIVFANTLGNGFVDNWDDNGYVLNNEIIKQLNWKNLKEIFSSFCIGIYHPLTILSYTIEYKLFGLNPFSFHITNYILHILNAILVYLFLKRFTGKPWVAAITSLFFAIHPMHVESVAWISERKDVLYTFFFLLSLNSYSKYLITGEKITSLIWSFIWFFLSLMSKSAAVCLPLVLVLMDYYHHKKLTWKILIPKIPFFLLALFFGILAVSSQRSVGAIYDLTPLFSIIERVFLVSYSTVYYIFKVFAPFNLSTLHFYPVKSGGMLPIEYYLALPALLLLIWGVFKSGSFKHELIFGLLFYFVTIAMVLQIIPAGRAIVSERYSYVPYIGIFFIFGQFFSYIKDKKFSFSSRIKSIVSIVLIVLTVLYSFLTYERNKVWKNGIVLFTDVIEKYPDQEFAWLARGNTKNGEGDFDGALADYNKAIRLNPDYSEALNNRAYIKEGKGDFDGALADYNKAIQLNPDYPEAFNNRGNVYNKINKFDSALADYNIAIKMKPDYTDAFYNRGNVYNKINKFDSALADFTITIQMKPDFPDALNDRGISLLNLNRMDESLRDFNKAIELNPQYAEAYNNRGNVYNKINKFDSALADFTIAIKMKPDFPEAFYNRGISLANLNRMDESLRDFNKAIELNPQYADAYFNRGIAKFNLNDTGACNDWLLAQQYGHPQAAAVLQAYCK